LLSTGQAHLDQLGLSNRRDNNISSADNVSEIFSLGVADGDRRIGAQQQLSHGAANNVAAANNNGVLARQVHTCI
jgi:hypothetical protein